MCPSIIRRFDVFRNLWTQIFLDHNIRYISIIYIVWNFKMLFYCKFCYILTLWIFMNRSKFILKKLIDLIQFYRLVESNNWILRLNSGTYRSNPFERSTSFNIYSKINNSIRRHTVSIRFTNHHSIFMN